MSANVEVSFAASRELAELYITYCKDMGLEWKGAATVAKLTEYFRDTPAKDETPESAQKLQTVAEGVLRVLKLHIAKKNLLEMAKAEEVLWRATARVLTLVCAITNIELCYCEHTRWQL